MGLSSCYSAIPRQWRIPRAIYVLFAIELAFSVAALALFGIAQPDLYRTRLWQEGSDHGWASNPNEIVYAYANYKPMKVPLPWSQFVTNFNVVIAVLSLFLLLVKGIMFICSVFYPLLSAFIHAVLIALYAISIHAQSASDMSDPDQPQPGAPWYLTKSCGPPVSPSLAGYCKQAKASFAITILLCALFAVYLLFSLASLYPTRAFRSSRASKLADTDSEAARPWEMSQVPPTPGTSGGMKSPITPRTMAFNTLSGDRKGKSKARKASGQGEQQVRIGEGSQGVPLRHHISMGDETYQGPSER
ncbi:MAG: hypothetical protein HETSPECPRED_000120 [Heterodermia speciosa]|uniref:Uncharacterized protein n=1 Tax=Heterodermia speciosa TaxID=116794 RepID=A0A8H3EHI9_9LECA|nr:MAG: hypothetical protein HETSPECPRED_000120 [Heterodermia speciosa]